MQNNLI